MDWAFGTVNTTKYECAKAVFEQLVNDTPVLTGFARASWSAGINSAPNSGVHFFGGETIPPPIFSVSSRTRADDAYVIANDAPYIERLDAGWSAQAPIGFIARAVGRGLNIGMQRAQSRI